EVRTRVLPRPQHPDRKEPDTMKAQQELTVTWHQPGQDVFKSVLPDDVNWRPFSAFPPPVRMAVIVGEPAESGPYTIRVRVPHGVILMPHKHPEDRIYTV